MIQHIKKERIKIKICEYLSTLNQSIIHVGNFYDHVGYNVFIINHNAKYISVSYPIIPSEISNDREILNETIKSYYNIECYAISIVEW